MKTVKKKRIIKIKTENFIKRKIKLKTENINDNRLIKQKNKNENRKFKMIKQYEKIRMINQKQEVGKKIHTK